MAKTSLFLVLSLSINEIRQGNDAPCGRREPASPIQKPVTETPTPKILMSIDIPTPLRERKK